MFTLCGGKERDVEKSSAFFLAWFRESEASIFFRRNTLTIHWVLWDDNIACFNVDDCNEVPRGSFRSNSLSRCMKRAYRHFFSFFFRRASVAIFRSLSSELSHDRFIAKNIRRWNVLLQSRRRAQNSWSFWGKNRNEERANERANNERQLARHKQSLEQQNPKCVSVSS